MYVVIVAFILFMLLLFKQKTAYEMRISDWSSDVCSSDLVGKEFDPDTLGLFKGTRETCHKPVFGMVNCCAGKVSGLFSGGVAAAAAWAGLSGGPAALAGIATQFLTAFLCDDAEKQLDVKDRLSLCVSIGSYCSKSFLGVCSTKRKAYCCFESKLTQIGRA